MTVGQRVTFAQMLRHYRRAAGLSQAALAERAQLSRDGVSALERGVSHAPRRDTIYLLLAALELSSPERDLLLAAARSSHSLATSSRASPRNAHMDSLPRPLTPLVGRDQEVAALSQLLCRDDVYLVTLTGAPGIGKTRLAVDVARAVASEFPGGVTFVALASVREAAVVIPTITHAARLRGGGEQAMTVDLVTEPETHSLLLLLDNFERVVEAAPALVDLMEEYPYVKALVTSRAPLRVRGEREFPLHPLDLPGDITATGADGAGLGSAVELFARHAVAVQPEFALTPQVAPVVAEICRQLDGLPLAIELAAARIKLLPPATLLERLTPALPLLTRGDQDLPERQHTMRRAIAWSYDQLDPALQRYFRAFAIFAGGWTLEAAEQVCGPAEDGAFPVLDALAALIDQSLVARMTADGYTSRFRLLATLREFGLERLTECGEMDAIARRHARYYMELAEAWEVDLREAQQAMSRLRQDVERNNLDAALRWTLRHDELEIAGRLAGALAGYWCVGGYSSEGRAWLGEVAEAYSRHPESRWAPPLVRAHAKLMRGVALLATRLMVGDDAGAIAGESVGFSSASGDIGHLA